MAGWTERVTDWEVDVESINAVGPTYKGSGTRVFVENTVGIDSLPALGSSMYDPADSVTYTGIYLTNLKYNRTHSACGDGRTVTAIYSSEAAKKDADDEKETYGVYSGGLKVITVDASADWAWWTDDATDGNAANLADPTKMMGRVAESIQWLVPTGSFSIRKEVLPAAFNAWKTTFIGLVGKVNNAVYEGFPIGCVLLNSFDASRTLNEDGDDVWQIDVQYLWRVIADKAFDGWQWLPVNTYVNQEGWGRPLMVVRSEGAGIQSGNHFIYEYGAIQGAVA